MSWAYCWASTLSPASRDRVCRSHELADRLTVVKLGLPSTCCGFSLLARRELVSPLLPDRVHVGRLERLAQLVEGLRAVAFELLAVALQDAIALVVVVKAKFLDERRRSRPRECELGREVVATEVELVPDVHVLLQQGADDRLARLRDADSQRCVLRDAKRYGDPAAFGRNPQLCQLGHHDLPGLALPVT